MFYVLLFIKLDTCEVHIAGITANPNKQWMKQIARNLTMEEWGFPKPSQYLIHDRDSIYCPAFQDIVDTAGVKQVELPTRSPNLDAFAERWVKSETLSKSILFGERSLRHALKNGTAHYHEERPHQGISNVIRFR